MIEAVRERLVFFPSGDLTLAGVLAMADQPNGRTVLMPWGASTAPSSGVNRVRTRLARTLAEEGFHSFRFDYPGVGESEGNYTRGEMSEPMTAEIQASMTWLHAEGLDRVVIVANCFGSWSSLLAAPTLSGVDGMFLVNCPVRRDHVEVRAGVGWRWWAKSLKRLRIKKLRDPEYRAQYVARYEKMLAAKRSTAVGSGTQDKRFTRAVRYLLDRRIPVLLMYGDHDFLGDFEKDLEDGLGAEIDRAGPPTRVVTVTDRLEGFGSLESQDLLLTEVVSWLHSLPSPTVSSIDATPVTKDE